MKQRLTKYKLSPKEFINLVLKQHNSCAICGKKAQGETLHIDHDHETGKVRGLLCQNCNTGLGKFYDNIQFFESAIDYLKKSKQHEHQ